MIALVGGAGKAALAAELGPDAVVADGPTDRPLTVPGPLEPQLPAGTATVVVVVGATALGRVIADQCGRPLRVAAVAGCSPHERLTPAHAAEVLCSERGGRKGITPGVRTRLVVTDADGPERELAAELIRLCEPTFDEVELR